MFTSAIVHEPFIHGTVWFLAIGFLLFGKKQQIADSCGGTSPHALGLCAVCSHIRATARASKRVSFLAKTARSFNLMLVEFPFDG